MKGTILAGGTGTRLNPLTKITNKHLLPVYNRPMILYPLETLKKSGISEIMVVCGKEHGGDFMNFLGSGKDYEVKISYALQDKNNAGISDALSYVEDFADNGSIVVILADNIFEDNFERYIKKFQKGAMIFLKKVQKPERFGVAVFGKNGKKLIKIEEKPRRPKSNYAQSGFYIFDNSVFSKIKTLKPSWRGELELTDVVNMYLKDGQLNFGFVRGFWSDAGTLPSLLRAANWVAKKYQNE
jgi:glucose-1-phosphate thymidylyltransferase